MAENSHSKLVAEPRVYRFSAADDKLPGKNRLVELLLDQNDTQPVAIEKESDVLLDGKGLVQSRYRMTSPALSQLCSVLAPGLVQTVQSLAGMRKRTKDHPSETYSVKRAISLLNDMIRGRFSLLERGYRFILDRRNRRIEGVVGPKYRFLSNLEMYQRADAFVGQVGSGVFFEAALTGRRLQLRYKNVARAFALPTPTSRMEPYFGGWHFSNSELGDCCVKGSAILFRQWSGTMAIQPYDTETKLVHIQGRKFEDKLRDVFATVQTRVAKIPECELQLRRLSATPLRLGGEKTEYEQRCSEIETALKKGGTSVRVAGDALTRAIVHGSYRAETITVGRVMTATEVYSPHALKAIGTRTAFDVYNALGYLARQYQPDHQEAIEQIAFKLLTNQISLE